MSAAEVSHCFGVVYTFKWSEVKAYHVGGRGSRALTPFRILLPLTQFDERKEIAYMYLHVHVFIRAS